eukprot:2134782-Amphidinium_carterae.1
MNVTATMGALCQQGFLLGQDTSCATSHAHVSPQSTLFMHVFQSLGCLPEKPRQRLLVEQRHPLQYVQEAVITLFSNLSGPDESNCKLKDPCRAYLFAACVHADSTRGAPS